MKRIFRPLYLTLAFAFTLASCGPQKMISTPVENIDNLPLKTTPIAENDLKRWSHLDLVNDTIPGMSVDKAYKELLKGKKGQKVIVGIVDSGVDINHEDLKAVIWANAKEIAGNGIDDDKNWYIDDVHGWNFLGNAVHEQLEMTRIVKKGPGTPDYDKAKAELEEERKGLDAAKPQYDMISKANESIKKHLKKETYTIEDVNAIKTEDKELLMSKNIMTQVSGMIGEGFVEKFEEEYDHVFSTLNYNSNSGKRFKTLESFRFSKRYHSWNEC